MGQDLLDRQYLHEIRFITVTSSFMCYRDRFLNLSLNDKDLVLWKPQKSIFLVARSLTLVLMGGGVDSTHTIFICENNRKSTKITHCIEIFYWEVVLKKLAFSDR